MSLWLASHLLFPFPNPLLLVLIGNTVARHSEIEVFAILNKPQTSEFNEINQSFCINKVDPLLQTVGINLICTLKLKGIRHEFHETLSIRNSFCITNKLTFSVRVTIEKHRIKYFANADIVIYKFKFTAENIKNTTCRKNGFSEKVF